MRKRLFPLLIALSALAVSGSAAFYSVFGLSKLFAGASTQVIIMAGSLEFAKLVVASLLYQYWDTINKWLRSYLAIACFVLMIITSGGIYGFLSGAYQSTATQSALLDKSLAILNQKQIRFQETKEDLTIEKTQINKSISDLRVSLSNPTSVSWYDKNAEQVITTTSSSARRALQGELKTTITDRNNLNIKLEAVVDSISKTDMTLLEKEISNEAESELGPLKYLAETTGKDMNQVVNWFLLLIIFVFDPLAIALVVASNMAFAQIRKPEEVVVDEAESFESLKQRVKENQDNLKKEQSEVKMSVPEGKKLNTSYSVDHIFDELEDFIPEPEVKVVEKIVEVEKKEEPIHEGRQMAKGLETMIEVMEEEEKDVVERRVEKKKEELDDTSDEHTLYHGSEERNKTYSDNDKRTKRSKRRRGIKKIRKPNPNNPLGGTLRDGHNPNPYRG